MVPVGKKTHRYSIVGYLVWVKRPMGIAGNLEQAKQAAGQPNQQKHAEKPPPLPMFQLHHQQQGG